MAEVTMYVSVSVLIFICSMNWILQSTHGYIIRRHRRRSTTHQWRARGGTRDWSGARTIWTSTALDGPRAGGGTSADPRRTRRNYEFDCPCQCASSEETNFDEWSIPWAIKFCHDMRNRKYLSEIWPRSSLRERPVQLISHIVSNGVLLLMTVDIYDRQSSLPSSSVHAAVSTTLLLAALAARLMRREHQHEKPGHFSPVNERVSRLHPMFFRTRPRQPWFIYCCRLS